MFKSAILKGSILGVLRYLQLKPRMRLPWMNIGSLVALSLACLGMTLVGNFQVVNPPCSILTHSIIYLNKYSHA